MFTESRGEITINGIEMMKRLNDDGGIIYQTNFNPEITFSYYHAKYTDPDGVYINKYTVARFIVKSKKPF